MATNLKKVQPGGIIESDQMNQIVDAIQGLEAAVSGLGWSTGTVTVPSMFGKTLNSAMAIINQPQTKLKLGNTLDAYGAALDPNLSDTRQRIVIGQSPPPDARVNPNTFLNLLLSAKPSTGGGSGGGTLPTIGSFNPLKTSIGEKVKIFGTNFDPDPLKNKVSFADVEAEKPEQASQTQLLVRVPKNIPNPPTGNAEKKVSVTVKCPNGIATGETTLLAALPGDPPTISTIVGGDPESSELLVGEIVTITGTNFSESLQENKITFGTKETGPETSENPQTTLLRVRVPEPDNIQGGGIPVFLDISVTVKGRQSNLINKGIIKP